MTSRWSSIMPKINMSMTPTARNSWTFFGGILTVSVGHCNEKVTKAIDEQTHKVQHMSTLYANEPQVLLAEKLAQITPGRLEKSFFTNSGTEANETAVLLAQIHTQCQDVITLRHSYSGRSYLALEPVGAIELAADAQRRARRASHRQRLLLSLPLRLDLSELRFEVR